MDESLRLQAVPYKKRILKSFYEEQVRKNKSQITSGFIQKSYINPVTEEERPIKRCPHIWQFFLALLANPKFNSRIIKWIDKEARLFKIVKPDEVADLWGAQKKRNYKKMDYEKMARGLR